MKIKEFLNNSLTMSCFWAVLFVMLLCCSVFFLITKSFFEFLLSIVMGIIYYIILCIEYKTYKIESEVREIEK